MLRVTGLSDDDDRSTDKIFRCEICRFDERSNHDSQARGTMSGVKRASVVANSELGFPLRLCLLTSRIEASGTRVIFKRALFEM